jgi:hypothetical protein
VVSSAAAYQQQQAAAQQRHEARGTPLATVLAQYKEAQAAWAHEKVGTIKCMKRCVAYTALTPGLAHGLQHGCTTAAAEYAWWLASMPCCAGRPCSLTLQPPTHLMPHRHCWPCLSLPLLRIPRLPFSAFP